MKGWVKCFPVQLKFWDGMSMNFLKIIRGKCSDLSSEGFFWWGFFLFSFFLKSALNSCLEESTCPKRTFSAASPWKSNKAPSKLSGVFHLFSQVVCLINAATGCVGMCKEDWKASAVLSKASALEGHVAVSSSGNGHSKNSSNDRWTSFSVCRNIWIQIWHCIFRVQTIVPHLSCVPERHLGGTSKFLCLLFWRIMLVLHPCVQLWS